VYIGCADGYAGGQAEGTQTFRQLLDVVGEGHFIAAIALDHCCGVEGLPLPARRPCGSKNWLLTPVGE